MAWKQTLAFPVGLGVGLVLASVGAALFWFQGPSVPSSPVMTLLESPVTAPAAPVTRADLDAVTADLARMQDRDRVGERLASAVQREVAELRALVIQVRQEQEAMARARAKASTTPAEARREGTAGPVREDTAGPLPSTSADEVERAEAHVRAQLELIEGTLLAEAPDPTWRDAAEQTLHEVFQREEGAGFTLVQADCRTTMCRLEVALDGSMPQDERFAHVLHLIAWPGPSVVRLEEGAAAAVVMYLARDGYALPDAGE